ncbi:hypothetical protein F5Y19DRAFT_493605 [Xylariaceae sp. FL1651]|nr:hypothetical protein F5Y19DRAFT_493605 [Xylariaceae sp. FL1651]
MEPISHPPAPENIEESSLNPAKPHIAKRYNFNLLTCINRSSRTWLIVSTILGLLVSVGLIILSEVVKANSSRIYSDDLQPSCTDLGSSASEHIFALDLAFGNFTFTQAKIIDVVWDTVIGQGGRFLHGWILYRCIIYPLLVLALETSTVTYAYYTTLAFSNASVETLWQLIKTFPFIRSLSVFLCTILLIYTLGYTLFFSVIWSTATGYLSLSHKLYAMPDGEIVPLNTEDLSLCWVLEPGRLELPDAHIEIGPNFSAILPPQRSLTQDARNFNLNISENNGNSERRSQVYNLQFSLGGWKLHSAADTIWNFFGPVFNDSSKNFLHLYQYALTRQFLQIGLNAEDWMDNGARTELMLSVVVNNGEAELGGWCETKPSSTTQCPPVNFPGLYSSVYAVHFDLPGEQDSVHEASQTYNTRPYNESTIGRAYRDVLFLDKSIPSGPGIIPYNSTIQLNGSSIDLPAPFLDIGFNCSGNTIFSSLGNCVCYKGKPIPIDLLSGSRAICNTAPGYVWGFSSPLTRLGLVLEAVWLVCCFIAYPWLSFRSKLLNTEPIKSAKAMRLLLDCSESAFTDLGQDAKKLREVELTERLKRTQIGYQAKIYDGKLNYRIVSGLSRKGLTERLSDTADQFERQLNKTVPILNRLDEHFHPLNRMIDPIHDAMNLRFDEASTTLRSQLRPENGKKKPTDDEVYEDLNWRF